MKVVILNCWNCGTHHNIGAYIDERGHIPVPRTICAKCLNELDYEIKETDESNNS